LPVARGALFLSIGFYLSALGEKASDSRTRLIQIKALPVARLHDTFRKQRSRSMSAETAVILVAISIPFIVFAMTLFWVERQTAHISH
jgi:hypothetical protein